ncbi:MAG TPA: phosphodiester glycosidase family protein [Flavisolibacter sp.]|jgi:exopolysaccharide biosynthesis protein
MKYLITTFFLFASVLSFAQLQWKNVDSLFGPLPKSVHVYFTNQAIDTSPFKAYYVIAELKDKKLDFTTDTTLNRRFTPMQFFEKNQQPLLVVNGTFFSFETNRNLNVVVSKGNLVSYNVPSMKQKKGDTAMDIPIYRSAIGLDKKRNADIAWIKTDSVRKMAFANQYPTGVKGNLRAADKSTGETIQWRADNFLPWKMQTAIGGGPVIVQNGDVRITNEYEKMFTGKAINDKHPRTAMGYTKDNKLIILVIEGRTKESGGATLVQESQILKDVGCIEALNLDGGGSSCLLINGKETIKPSDAKGQRPVPAVFMILQKK